MAWIKTVDETNAEGELARTYAGLACPPAPSAGSGDGRSGTAETCLSAVPRIGLRCAKSITRPPPPACRVSRQGRPRRLRGVFGSTNGWSNSHCTSVSSISTDVPVNSTPHNYLVRFVFMR